MWQTHNPILHSPHFTNDFYRKINHLQGCLTSWNKHVFGHVGQNKKRIRARLVGIQRELSRRHSRFLLQLEHRLINAYNTILYQEFLLWQMKSRILWLSYGDENTHFFHVQTRVRCAWQIIATLKTESDDSIRGQELHDYVIGYFQRLFQSGVSNSLSSTPDTLFSSSEFNPQELRDSLSRFPDQTEIQSTLKTMHPLKAPGLDGFHAHFYQHNWDIMGFKYF